MEKVALSTILEVILKYFKISEAELRMVNRTEKIVYARQLYFYLCRKLTEVGYAEIGKSINRDHTTVIHGENKIKSQEKIYTNVAKDIENLCLNIAKLQTKRNTELYNKLVVKDVNLLKIAKYNTIVQRMCSLV